MNFLRNLKLEKRFKYLLLSAAVVILLFAFSYALPGSKLLVGIITTIVALVGSQLVQYSSVQTYEKRFSKFLLETASVISILPTVLVIGALLSLNFFPNLGTPTKIITILAVGAVMYITSLVNNIFLVVYEEDESIPLFKVASAWSQILMIVAGIPFFAGIFKLPVNAFIQSAIVSATALFFTEYTTWYLQLDQEISEVSRGDRYIYSAIVSFIVFAASLTVSFVPSESFLRALFTASSTMFGMGYIQAHLKNQITKKLIAEYSVISIIFLLLVFLFN